VAAAHPAVVGHRAVVETTSVDFADGCLHTGCVPGFDLLWWLPLTVALSGVGLVAAWRAWRRREIAATVRRTGWALAPWAVLLLGMYGLVVRVGSATTLWVSRFVFDPTAWLGVATALVATGMIVLGGRFGHRSVAASSSSAPIDRRPSPAGDDDLAEIEAILRKRGIH